MATGRKSEAKRDLVATALASGKTHTAAAADCGVAERTIAYWLAEPAFKARVLELRSAMVGRAVGKLADAMSAAADELRRLVEGDAADTVKLGAARSILELAVKLRESTELEERLTELERRNSREDGK